MQIISIIPKKFRGKKENKPTNKPKSLKDSIRLVIIKK